MNAATPKIIVGYRTRAATLPEPFEPTFRPPANYKDAAKIAEWQDARRAEWETERLSYPYLSTLDSVFAVVIGPGLRDVGEWKYREPGSGKPPVALAVRTFLMKHFRETWEGAGGGPRPIFVGFDPRAFLKVWGLELTMPEVAQPLPPSVWYGTNNHRDIGTALVPDEYKAVLPLTWVLKLRGIAVPNWSGPGGDPELDVRVATQAAQQLGFLDE